MKILVVVDMQNDFIDGVLGTKEAEGIVDAVVRKIEQYEGKIVFTKDTHKEDYLNSQEGKYLPVLHCVKGTKGHELAPNIDRLAKKLSEENKTVIFEKPTFGSRELVQYLLETADKEAIEEIELIGLCTDICVISNAMLIKAFLPEVTVAVDSYCCAGVSPESHERALEAMKVCQIQVR